MPVLALWPPDAALGEPADVVPGEPADAVPEPTGAVLSKTTEPVNPEAVSNGTDTPPASHTEANSAERRQFMFVYQISQLRTFENVLP